MDNQMAKIENIELEKQARIIIEVARSSERYKLGTIVDIIKQILIEAEQKNENM